MIERYELLCENLGASDGSPYQAPRRGLVRWLADVAAIFRRLG